MAQLAWHDWLPIGLARRAPDGRRAAPRIFVMPATDPINPNVHPLIYRWNAILGQSQAAALEAAGKDGIIYNSTYTNFWQGAMAWSGWWHNQIGLLTEVASARIAAPVDQQRVAGRSAFRSLGDPRRVGPNAVVRDRRSLPPPTDTTPRTEYPRPWLGGHWTLRDIVDYELISTMALLDTAADRRETHPAPDLRGEPSDGRGRPAGRRSRRSSIPVESQHDPREAAHLVDRLMLGGVEVYRADAPFEVDDDSATRPAPSSIPMTQVFARYAKDLLEKQTYPESPPRAGRAPPEPPVRRHGLVARHAARRRRATFVHGAAARVAEDDARHHGPPTAARRRVTGNGPRFTFDYTGRRYARSRSIACSRTGARVAFDAAVATSRSSTATPRDGWIDASRETSALDAIGVARRRRRRACPPGADDRRCARAAHWRSTRRGPAATSTKAGRAGCSSSTSSPSRSVHNADIRDRAAAAAVRRDHPPRPDRRARSSTASTRSASGRSIAAASATSASTTSSASSPKAARSSRSAPRPIFAIDRLPIPVRDLKRGAAARSALRAGHDPARSRSTRSHPIGYGMAPTRTASTTTARSFALLEGPLATRPPSSRAIPIPRCRRVGLAEGRGLMAGRAAVVSVDMKPGRVVLFGLARSIARRRTRPSRCCSTRSTSRPPKDAAGPDAIGLRPFGPGSACRVRGGLRRRSSALRCLRSISGRSFLLRYTFDSALSAGVALVLHDLEAQVIERAAHVVEPVLGLDDDLVEALLDGPELPAAR